MLVTVRYFQAAKRWSGTDTEEIALPEGASVSDLAVLLSERHAQLGEARASLMFAVNAEHAESDRVLAEADEVAVMPPFSGG